MRAKKVELGTDAAVKHEIENGRSEQRTRMFLDMWTLIKLGYLHQVERERKC